MRRPPRALLAALSSYPVLCVPALAAAHAGARNGALRRVRRAVGIVLLYWIAAHAELWGVPQVRGRTSPRAPGLCRCVHFN